MSKELGWVRTPTQIELLERLIKKAKENPVKIGKRMIPMRAEDIRVGDKCEEGEVTVATDQYEPGFTYICYGEFWRRLCNHESVNLIEPMEIR